MIFAAMPLKIKTRKTEGKMAKAMYSVVIIEKGREKDFKDFWDRQIEINAKGEVLHPNLLAITLEVEAKNGDEATAIARAKYPERTIAHCYKIG
jgi:hypothetical protein